MGIAQEVDAITVDTVADLANLSPRQGQTVVTRGYTTAGDGEGNRYYYDATDATSTDLGFYLNGPGGIGRYIAEDLTYQVVPSGQADYSDYLSRAIDQGTRLQFGSGTFPCLTAIDKVNVSRLDIDWAGSSSGKTIIDMTSISAASVYGIRIYSNRTSVNLPADLPASSRSISATVAGLQSGDLLRIAPHPDRITDSSVELWSDVRTNYYRGELIRVDNYTAGTVELSRPTYEAYTALNGGGNQNFILVALEKCSVRMKNISIHRDANALCLGLDGCEVNLDNVTTKGGREAGIQAWYSYGYLNECGGSDAWYAGTGNGYVAVLASCEEFVIEGGVFSGGRHALSLGGNEPCRNIRISKVTAFSNPADTEPGLDCHENCEKITFSDVTTDGVYLGGRDITLENANVVGRAGLDSSVTIEATKTGGSFTVSNLRVDRGLYTGTGGSLRVMMGTNNIAIKNISINAYTHLDGQGIPIFMDVNGKTGCSLENLEVEANVSSSNQPSVATNGQFPVKNAVFSGTYTGGTANHNVFFQGDGETVIRLSGSFVSASSVSFAACFVRDCLLASASDCVFDAIAATGSNACFEPLDVESFKVENCILKNSQYAIFPINTVLASMTGNLSFNVYSGNANEFLTSGSNIYLTSALSGAGTPEGSVAAPVGSTYRRTDGGSGTAFYVKESGTGNTGWVAQASATTGSTRKEKIDIIAYAATISLDFDTGDADHKIITMTGNITSLGFTITRPGYYSFVLEQDATGGRSVLILQTVEGTQPTLNTAANAKTVYNLFFDGAAYFWA